MDVIFLPYCCCRQAGIAHPSWLRHFSAIGGELANCGIGLFSFDNFI